MPFVFASNFHDKYHSVINTDSVRDLKEKSFLKDTIKNIFLKPTGFASFFHLL